MELVKIETPQENNWIYDMVQKIALDGGYYTWIGARQNSTAGTYTWCDDTPVTWTVWAAGEPSGHTCMSARFVPDEMQWDTHGCDTAYPYVCEIPDTPGAQTITPAGDCPKTIKDFALSDTRVGPGGKVQNDFTDGKFAFPNTTNWTYFREIKLSPIEDCTLMCLETPGCDHVTYFDDFTCRLFDLTETRDHIIIL
ncbi:macrophage mannose receptor 1-like [Haliotis rubra]|uniref:macrophage mannose receptor 1-like n=1 Tax=Haliotis rubra TaxID=36100 RepID=UPI001EE61680|nr:macrophage mannose receptor 1-like [Haliotis rubra]